MFELKCLKFLRSLWTIADGYDDLIFLDRDGSCHLKMSEDSVFAKDASTMLTYLAKEGYVEMDGPHRFRITAMGFHPYAIQGRLVLCEIVRSVVFPIIVAFLTTLITLAIAK